MPVTGIKCTAFYEDNGRGISETHYYVPGSQTSQAYNPFLALIKKRMATMGAGVQAIGGRMSLAGVKRVVEIIDPQDLAGLTPGSANYNFPDGHQEPNDPDFANVCILLRTRAGAQSAGSLFMAGVPDAAIRAGNEGAAVALVPGFATKLNSYLTLLKSGIWGMRTRTKGGGAPPLLQVTSVLSQVGTGNVGLVVTGAVGGIAPTTFVYLTGFTRTNVAYASLNGRWQVDSVAAGPGAGENTIYLRASSTIPTFQLVHLGTVQLEDFSTVAYTSIDLVGKTTRKRGNRFLAPLARRRVRRPISL